MIMDKYQEYFNSKKFSVMIWIPTVMCFLMAAFSLLSRIIFESSSGSVDVKIYCALTMPFFFTSVAMETLKRELKRQAKEKQKS